MTLNGRPKDNEWVCDACKRVFPTREELRQHNLQNLHELFYKRVNNQYECQLCKERFLSYSSYMWHWENNDWHNDEAGSRLLYRPDYRQHKWIVRPVEKKLFDRKIHQEREKLPLKQGINANKTLLDEIKNSLEHNEMLVAECIGRQGSGKSVAMVSFARLIQIAWYRRFKQEVMDGKRKAEDLYMPKIWIGSNLEETIRYTKMSNAGDIVIQDEDPTALGGGASASRTQIENLLKIMRERCVHYMFVSPESVSYVTNVNLILETHSKNVKDRMTKLILYDRLQFAIGWITLKILPDDDPLMIRYLRKKRKNIQALMETSLHFSTKPSEERIQKDIELMKKTLLNICDESEFYKLSRPFLREHAASCINGIISYQNYIGNRCWVAFQQENIDREFEVQLPQAVEKCGLNYEWVEYRKPENGMDMMMFACDEIATELRLPDSLLKGSLAFKYHILLGQSQKDAAREAYTRLSGSKHARMYWRKKDTNVSAGYVQQFIESKDGLGTVVEEGVRRWWFPQAERLGGQSQPDLILDGCNIEVKARSDTREPEYLVKPLIRSKINAREPVKMVIVQYDTKTVTVRFYEVRYNDIEPTDKYTNLNTRY